MRGIGRWKARRSRLLSHVTASGVNIDGRAEFNQVAQVADVYGVPLSTGKKVIDDDRNLVTSRFTSLQIAGEVVESGASCPC